MFEVYSMSNAFVFRSQFRIELTIGHLNDFRSISLVESIEKSSAFYNLGDNRMLKLMLVSLRYSTEISGRYGQAYSPLFLLFDLLLASSSH